MEQPVNEMINAIGGSEQPDDQYAILPELRIGMTQDKEVYVSLSFHQQGGTTFTVLMSDEEAVQLGNQLMFAGYRCTVAQGLVNTKENFEEAKDYLMEMMPALGLDDVQ